MTETPRNGGTDTETFTEAHTAPAQLILPETAAGLKIRGWAVDQVLTLIPGVVLVMLGTFASLYGVAIGEVILGAGALITVGGGYLMVTTPAHQSALDRVRGRLTAIMRQRSLPLDRAGAADIHGVERIMSDGSVEMTDGRIVRFARVHGRNTDRQTAEQEQTMLNALQTGIDSSIEDFDFSIYSTSTSPDPRAITEKYREVWLDEWDEDEAGAARDMRGYLESIIDWEPERCEIAMATEWEHYVVVSVAPDAIDTPPVGTTDASSRRQQQQVEAERRLTAVRQAFEAVPGVTAQPLGGAAHARVIARHWAGARHPFHADTAANDRAPVTIWPDYEDLDREPGQKTTPHSTSASLLTRLRALVPVGPERSATPASISDDRIKEILAGSQYDERPGSDLVVAGEQYTRTFWIADWPTQSSAKFLKRLHTLRGVDLDVHLRFTKRNPADVKEQLKDETGEIDASIMERKEASNPLDAGVLEDEMDSFVALFKLLHHTDVQPWGLTMYVTVRAGTRQALAHAEDLIENGHAEEADLTLDIAKQQALEEACEEVEDTLTDGWRC